MNRRTFTRTVGTALLGSSLAPSIRLGSTPPSDQIRVGLIGANGMGWANVQNLLGDEAVSCVAIADVDAGVLERRLKNYAEHRPNEVATYGDYRELLDRADVDVVVIGTPDHWHCRMMVDAVASGRHVYVEKPIANTIEECNLMVDAAAHYGTVVQVGQWQRSGAHYAEAIDLVRSGVLGRIRLVKVWAYQGWMKPVPVQPDGPAPEGVDYAMWLGPAPTRPFNPNRFHFNFRWFWDYAGGLMTDWGVHEIDIALYAMQAHTAKSVVASGGKLAYPDDASETPDTLQAIFEFDDFNMLWEHATGIDNGPYGRREGIAFIGNNGTLVLNRDGYEVVEERASLNYSDEGDALMQAMEPVVRPDGVNYLRNHTDNFLAAVRANDASLLNTPIASGALAAINAQMGNIAYRTGTKIYWDDATQTFKDHAEATALTKAEYHNGWTLPAL